jgi:hypothetical protein
MSTLQGHSNYIYVLLQCACKIEIKNICLHLTFTSSITASWFSVHLYYNYRESMLVSIWNKCKQIFLISILHAHCNN